jgi:hypothetical protein
MLSYTVHSCYSLELDRCIDERLAQEDVGRVDEIKAR